jgi:phosphatidate cytidylyltransferase
MLRQRAVSLACLSAVVGVIAVIGGASFTVFYAIVLAMALRELYQLFTRAGLRPLSPVGYVIFGWFHFQAQVSATNMWQGGVLALAVVAPLGLIALRRPPQHATLDWAVTVMGSLYIGLAGAHAVLLRNLPGSTDALMPHPDHGAFSPWPSPHDTSRGLAWYLFTHAVVWVTDGSAYLIGRRWGRHRLAPTISPHKTVEGSLGGLVIASATAGAIAPLVGVRLPLAWAVAVGAILSVAAQASDLVQSLFKRQAGVKDSGDLIPGHGGVFDRVDSLLLPFIVAYQVAVAAGR